MQKAEEKAEAKAEEKQKLFTFFKGQTPVLSEKAEEKQKLNYFLFKWFSF